MGVPVLVLGLAIGVPFLSQGSFLEPILGIPLGYFWTIFPIAIIVGLWGNWVPYSLYLACSLLSLPRGVSLKFFEGDRWTVTQLGCG